MSVERNEETFEQLQATNKLLLKMVKNQKENNKNTIRVFIVTVVCYTILLISMVVGFFVYESQFEIVDTVTEETVTETTTYDQEVSGENSSINNVEGNQYNDNATHNE